MTQPSTTPQRLRRSLAAVPNLGPGTRVLDAGCGTGVLEPLLQEAGVEDILAVDVSPRMIDAVMSRFPAASVLGNEPGSLLGNEQDDATLRKQQDRCSTPSTHCVGSVV